MRTNQSDQSRQDCLAIGQKMKASNTLSSNMTNTHTHGCRFLFAGEQETMDTFYSSAAQVAGHLLKGVASHLGLSREHFGPSFEPHTSYLRLNYYPPCPEPSTFSVNRHTDAGALTVLLQENGTVALQVRQTAAVQGRNAMVFPLRCAIFASPYLQLRSQTTTPCIPPP